MAVSANKIVSIEKSKRSTEHDSIDALMQHRSQELIIGLCGASGSGVKTLKEKLIAQLKAGSYHVEHIRISSLLAFTQPTERANELITLTGMDDRNNILATGCNDVPAAGGGFIHAKIRIMICVVMQMTAARMISINV